MTKQQLAQKLHELNVSRELYSLEGNFIPDRMIMVNSDSDWIVLYFDPDKSIKNIRKFDSETEACSYFYNYYRLR